MCVSYTYVTSNFKGEQNRQTREAVKLTSFK